MADVTMQEYYTKYFTMVEDYVRSHSVEEQDVYDITADIMLNSWEKLAKGFEPDIPMRRYVKRAAYYHMRRLNINKYEQVEFNDVHLTSEVEDVIVNMLFMEQTANRLLSALDEQDAYILRRIYLEDARFSEVAEELGWSRERTVKHELRAHQTIREYVSQQLPMSWTVGIKELLNMR